MENDYRITKFHGTLIGDNRIPELPDGEKTKVFSSTNGKTAWVDLPTDVGKDANGFAVLRHDGAEIAGQRKSVKLADVRDNGAVIGRDQTTSAPQADELITKAYADKEYGAPISVESNAEDLPVTITLTDEQSTAIENQIANGHFNLIVNLSAMGQKLLFNQAVALAEGGVLYYAMAMISFSLFSAESIVMTYSKIGKTLTLSQQDPLFKNETSLRVIDNKVSLYSGDNDTGAPFGKSYSVAKINGQSILNDPDTVPVQPSYYAPETINNASTPKVLTSKSGAFEWSDLPSGGASVSPCLNLMDMDTGDVRTSITEEEKTNLEKGLYNSVLYLDGSSPSDESSLYFPECLSGLGYEIFTKFNIELDEASNTATIVGMSEYQMQFGEKGSDGNYPITITKTLNAHFGSGGGGSGVDNYLVKDIVNDSVTLTNDEFKKLAESNCMLVLRRTNGHNIWYYISSSKVVSSENGAVSEIQVTAFDWISSGNISVSESYILTFAPNSLTSNVTRTETSTSPAKLFNKFSVLTDDFTLTNILPCSTADNGKALSVVNGEAQWADLGTTYSKARFKHTVTLKTSAGAILWTQTLSNSKNTPVNSYADLKTLFGGELLAGYGEYAQLDLRGGTEATDKMIKADGTEATLASLGAIVYTDVCFLPK